MIQIIKNRQQYLLKHIDGIYLNHLNSNNNDTNLQINFDNILNEIDRHEQYIKNQINQYNILIQPKPKQSQSS